MLSRQSKAFDPNSLHADSLFTTIQASNRWDGTAFLQSTHDSFHDKFVTRQPGRTTITEGPHAQIDTPVYAKLTDHNSPVVAMLRSAFAFDFYMSDLLPNGIRGIYAVLSNTCGEVATYELTGNKAIYLGREDYHDPTYNKEGVPVSFHILENATAAQEVGGHCLYTITVYPTTEFADVYRTKTPVIFMSVVAATFCCMIFVFFIYDRLVDIRNNKTVEAAARSSTIVSSLFPSNVRDRLYAQAHESAPLVGTHSQIKTYLKKGATAPDECIVDGVTVYKTKPIAELFPETTVMVRYFAVLVGVNLISSFSLLVRRYCWVYCLEQLPRACTSFHASGDALSQLR